MRLCSAVLSVCVACVWSGCGGSSADATCGKLSACGGEIVGKWQVANVCFENPEAIVSDSIDEPACSDVFRNVAVKATGSYSFDKDGSKTTSLSLMIDIDSVFSAACLSALDKTSVVVDAQLCASLEASYKQQAGFTKASCVLEKDACACKLSAAPAPASTTGSYSVAGKNLIDGSNVDPYCVSGDTLRISVSESNLTGTIVLTRK